MTFSNINVGIVPNDGTGDALRDAMIDVNSNFETVRVNFQSQVTTSQLNLALANYVLAATYSSQIASMTASILSLENSLAGKSPLVHTHIISDVTGLQIQLDGKVSSTTFNNSISSINGTISELSNSKINDAPDNHDIYARANNDWEVIPRIKGGKYVINADNVTTLFNIEHNMNYPPFSHVVTFNINTTSLTLVSDADNRYIIVKLSDAPRNGDEIIVNWVAFFSEMY